jgi:hypothetical protein
MKFWVKFLKIFYRLILPERLAKVGTKSIETVLENSVSMLDPEMISEIRLFILGRQNTDGGFADRGGKSDIYYSLFGCFVAEALGMTEMMEPLKKYVKSIVAKNNLIDVHLFCGTILYAKLVGRDSTSKKLKGQVYQTLRAKNECHQEYTGFLGILSLYYLGDYIILWRMVHRYRSMSVTNEIPCPVLAALFILKEIGGGTHPELVDRLVSLYRGKGGFVALQRTPMEDLLSTAVALYALNFLNADRRMMKPECLAFIDGLYSGGGFVATSFDHIPDVEYTFYGLLGLGSLYESDKSNSV